MTLRPDRWRLHYQTTLLSVAIVAAGVVVTALLTHNQTSATLFEHEVYDLRDETNLKAADVTGETLNLGRAVRKLSLVLSKDFAPEATPDRPAPAARVHNDQAAEVGRILTGRVGELLKKDADEPDPNPALAEVEWFALFPPGGSARPVVVTRLAAGGPVTGGAAEPAAPACADLLRRVHEQKAAAGNEVAETSGFVREGAPGSAVCRLYVARRVFNGSRDGSKYDIQTPHGVLVACLNVTRYFDALSRRASRHGYFLLDPDGKYLYHPDHARVGTDPPAGDAVAGAVKELRAAGDAAPGAVGKARAADRGTLVPANAHRGTDVAVPDFAFHHTEMRLPKPPPPDRVEAFNDGMAALAAREAAAAGGEPALRVSQLRPDGVRVELTHRTPEGLAAAREEAVRLLFAGAADPRPGWGERALRTVFGYQPDGEWHDPVEGNRFFGTLTPLPTGLGDPRDRPPAWFAAVAAVAEVKADAAVATWPVTKITAAVVSAAGAVVAFLMTWYVVRPLRDIERAARSTADLAKRVAQSGLDPERSADPNRSGSRETFALPDLPAAGPPEVMRLAAAFQDMLAELDRMATRLRQRSLELDNIIKQAADGVVLFDDRGRVQRANRAAEELFGYDPGELVGLRVQKLVRLPADSPLRLNDAAPGPGDSSTPASDRPADFAKLTGAELQAVRKDGTRFWAGAALNAVAFGGRTVYTGIIRDITPVLDRQNELDRLVKERTAELEAAMDQVRALARSKDLFLATVSHELRAPLNIIGGDVQLLQRAPLAPEVRKRVDRIRSAQLYQTALVNDILDYIKIIEGRLDLNPTEFPLARLLHDVADEMRPRLEAGGNRVEVDAPDALGVVALDQVRLKQVLYNLLGNAAKFTQNGVVRLAARRRPGPDGDEVVVDVADTGKGIKAEDLAKLFTPFGKLHDRQRNLEGTGLGLAICRGLCRQMGGDVTAASGGEGHGTTFTVTVKARLPGGTPPPRPPAPPPPPPVAAVANRRVLVVDDDPAVRELVTTHLELRGFEVTTAATGGDALNLVKPLRPAAILLDILMPGGLDGWGVLAALKADSETAGIPVIVASMVDDRSRGNVLGAADYVPKPVQDWDEVARLIRRYQGENRRVLVVEDDPEVRRLCREKLAPHGWDVVEADNGAAGLDRLRECVPAVVVLDFLMPVMDGFRFLEEVRENPAWAAVPVIALTAAQLSDDERAALHGRVREVVLKGNLDRDRLLDAVHALVERYAATGRTGEDAPCPRS